MIEISRLVQFLIEHAQSIGQSVLTVLLGAFFIKYIKTKLIALIDKHTTNKTVQLFVVNAVYMIMLFVLLIILLSGFGISTASLLAVLGTAGIAIGLAVKDSLANVAGGILLITLKPFKVGDVVDVMGVSGTVKEVNIYSTVLKSANNEYLYLPNAKVVNDKIINKTKERKRRLDLSIGVSYECDLKLAKATIEQALSKNSYRLESEDIFVAVRELADSAVVLAARLWVNTPNYTLAQFEALETIKEALDEAGVSIPFPQVTINYKDFRAS